MFSKNLIRFYLVVLVLLGFVSLASAQDNPEVKWKDGKKYIVHKIQNITFCVFLFGIPEKSIKFAAQCALFNVILPVDGLWRIKRVVWWGSR